MIGTDRVVCFIPSRLNDTFLFLGEIVSARTDVLCEVGGNIIRSRRY